jgi:hypothetical protein
MKIAMLVSKKQKFVQQILYIVAPCGIFSQCFLMCIVPSPVFFFAAWF